MGAIDSVIVLAGGDPADPGLAAYLPAGARVVAADSGLAQAAALGLDVDLVVGDMDSVDTDLLAEVEAAGAAVERHSPDKNATDLELALGAAQRDGARRVIVIGGAGGRLDHLLANALVLTNRAFAGLQVEWWVGPARAVVVRDSLELAGAPGDLVTLLALGGRAAGVETSGLRWPLADAELASGSTRGVSNELTAPTARISVEDGVLLVIHERSL